jgi:excisionase family DNA binding protein
MRPVSEDPRAAATARDQIATTSGRIILWTTDELAAYLSIPVATIYKWRQTNEGPPGYRIGKHLRFDPEDVTTWLAARREKSG